MALPIGNVMPSLATTQGKGVSTVILDFVFRDNALLLQNPEVFVTGAGGIGDTVGAAPFLPLIGFTYQQPDSMELLKYSYAEYPYLNKAVVANAFVKEPTTISIKALKPISKGNPIILNFASSTLLCYLIEQYADKGGLFALITMWGLIRNLALESLSTETIEGQGGVGFNFSFKKLNFDETITSQNVSNKLTQLFTGAGA